MQPASRVDDSHVVAVVIDVVLMMVRVVVRLMSIVHRWQVTQSVRD